MFSGACCQRLRKSALWREEGFTMNTEDMGQPILVEGWPLVKVCFVGPANEGQVQSWLQQMDDLFLRRTRFGLLTKTDEDSDFSAAGRKAMGLWFKLRREQLSLWCVGVARIAPQADAVERLAGPKMQAAMPCPIYASVDEEQARAWLQDRLTDM